MTDLVANIFGCLLNCDDKPLECVAWTLLLTERAETERKRDRDSERGRERESMLKTKSQTESRQKRDIQRSKRVDNSTDCRSRTGNSNNNNNKQRNQLEFCLKFETEQLFSLPQSTSLLPHHASEIFLRDFQRQTLKLNLKLVFNACVSRATRVCAPVCVNECVCI